MVSRETRVPSGLVASTAWLKMSRSSLSISSSLEIGTRTKGTKTSRGVRPLYRYSSLESSSTPCYHRGLYVIQNRHGSSTARHDHADTSAKLIPFAFTIRLPAPRYERAIVSRSLQGRIVRSVPVE